MKERPILFSAPEVKAILAGAKTQTRPLLKSEPSAVSEDIRLVRLRNGQQRGSCLYLDFDGVPGLSWKPYGGSPTQAYPHPEEASPYGVPGDRLWVRETFADEDMGPDDYPRLVYAADRAAQHYDRSSKSDVFYLESDYAPHRWKPSIFMPRWASRITLEVTGVRVERLQEITAVDACREGVVDPAKWNERTWDGNPYLPVRLFRDLWDAINAKRGPWASNPWVWVVEFKRITAAVTAELRAAERGRA